MSNNNKKISDLQDSYSSYNLDPKKLNNDDDLKDDKAYDVSNKMDSMDTNVDKLIKSLTSYIEDDHTQKFIKRKNLVFYTWIFFIFMTVTIFIIIFSHSYSDNLKYFLITGMFSSFVGLITIIYKYVFNSPKDYYKLIKDLLDWDSHKHGKK